MQNTISLKANILATFSSKFNVDSNAIVVCNKRKHLFRGCQTPVLRNIFISGIKHNGAI